MVPSAARKVNSPSIPRSRKNRTIRRLGNRHRTTAALAARRAATGCPARRAALAAATARAQRRATAPTPAAPVLVAGPVEGPPVEAVLASVVVAVASGESAAFSVEASRAAWLAWPAVPAVPAPELPVPEAPVAPVEPAPVEFVLAAGALDRVVRLGRDTPAITPPPASRAARAIPTVQFRALRWSLAMWACSPGCCGQGSG